jgi:nucleoside diphosphate kinase
MAVALNNQCISFYLLKPETYLFGKHYFIRKKIKAAGLKIIGKKKINLSFNDLMALYPNLMARITMSLRVPFLMDLDMYFVEGENVVSRLNSLKYDIRQELSGAKLGGFLHTPDSPQELKQHLSILLKESPQA